MKLFIVRSSTQSYIKNISFDIEKFEKPASDNRNCWWCFTANLKTAADNSFSYRNTHELLAHGLENVAPRSRDFLLSFSFVSFCYLSRHFLSDVNESLSLVAFIYTFIIQSLIAFNNEPIKKTAG